jgi:hypothetical protein
LSREISEPHKQFPKERITMKSNIVRLFVLTLAVAGFGATTVSAHAKAKLSTDAKDAPMPLCAPSDPTHCGLHDAPMPLCAPSDPTHCGLH